MANLIQYFVFHYQKKQFTHNLTDFIATTLIYLGFVFVLSAFIGVRNFSIIALFIGLAIIFVGGLIKYFILGYHFDKK